nr:hypothetical protein CFP56_52562 [Quercus suber]
MTCTRFEMVFNCPVRVEDRPKHLKSFCNTHRHRPFQNISSAQYEHCRKHIQTLAPVKMIRKDFCHSYACCNADLDYLQGLYQRAWQRLHEYYDLCRDRWIVPCPIAQSPHQDEIEHYKQSFFEMREWHRQCPARRRADSDWKHLKESGLADEGTSDGNERLTPVERGLQMTSDEARRQIL